MEIRQIKELAKQFVMVNKYNPLILYATVVSVSVAFSLIVLQIVWFALVFIPLFFLYAPVSYSSTDFYMRSYNLKTEENFRLFEGFKKENFFRVLFLSMIRTGFALIFAIGFFVGFGVALGYSFHPMAAIGIGLLFTVPFLFPASIYYARTSIAVYLLRSDQKLSAFAAFKMSLKIMKGKSFRVVQLFLSYLGWFLLGIVTVGLVFIYAMPHYQTAKSIYFRREILGIGDEEELPENYEESIKRLEIQQLNEEIEHAQDEPIHDKKRKKFDRNLIVDELDFEQQAADIRHMITMPEVILPPNARKMNPADLEIRENETFEEYRIRVQRSRNLREGNVPGATPGKRRSLEEEAALLSQDKERLMQEALGQTNGGGGDVSAEDEAARAERVLEEYFKTDEQVAQIVEQQVEQNTADINSYPGDSDSADVTSPKQEETAQQSDAWYEQALDEAAQFEERKKAVAEKIASLKADAKKSAERSADLTVQDRRSANDLRAQMLRSREQGLVERSREQEGIARSNEQISSVRSNEHVAMNRSYERVSDEALISQTRSAERSNRSVSIEHADSGKPSREEILERIRRERDKK